MRVLIVDDEALARTRLQQLLEDAAPGADAKLGFAGLAHLEIAQTGDALQAIALLRQQPFDVAFLDVNMPGASGLQLARELNELPKSPLVVFVTAHAEHALQAFELDAIDYLSKPLTAKRLSLALQKIERRQQLAASLEAEAERVLLIQERGRLLRLPLAQVLYIKAELKYLTVRTLQNSYLLDGSLGDIEQQYSDVFLRVHRSALVAKQAMVALEKQYDGDEGWAVRLQGIAELLPVSRRQLAAVRLAMQGVQ